MDKRIERLCRGKPAPGFVRATGDIDGVTFAECRTVVRNVEGIPVSFIDLVSLRKNKASTGRAKDRRKDELIPGKQERGDHGRHRDDYTRNHPLPEIAARFGLSQIRFSAVITDDFGCTFHDLLTDCRLGIARALLADPVLRVADIADRVGYVDARHFSRPFRRRLGVTPSEYRHESEFSP